VGMNLGGTSFNPLQGPMDPIFSSSLQHKALSVIWSLNSAPNLLPEKVTAALLVLDPDASPGCCLGHHQVWRNGPWRAWLVKFEAGVEDMGVGSQHGRCVWVSHLGMD